MLASAGFDVSLPVRTGTAMQRDIGVPSPVRQPPVANVAHAVHP